MCHWGCPAGPGMPRGPLPNTLDSHSALTTSICKQHLSLALITTRETEAKCRLAHCCGSMGGCTSEGRTHFFPMNFQLRAEPDPEAPCAPPQRHSAPPPPLLLPLQPSKGYNPLLTRAQTQDPVQGVACLEPVIQQWAVGDMV